MTPIEPPVSPGVAYLTSRYPALSHTFIEREVAALREQGTRVDTFSVRPWAPEDLKSRSMRAEAERTTVLLGADRSRAVPRAHAALARRRPGAYAAGLGRALRSGDDTAKARLWQCFYFAEAVLLHEQLRARGLRHVHAHFTNVAADVARLTVAIGRAIDGPGSPWRWSMTVHGPTEFENVDKVDLAAKVEDADAISVISDYARSQLMRLVDPSHWDKMSVVRMSVDAQAYPPPADGRVRAAGEPLRLLDVGRLVPEKGAPVLLEALALLRDRGIATTTRIVGAGELEETLRRRVAELRLGDVELVGPVGQDEIPAYYRWADAFVLPSFQEGLPVVLMEALATELPVVTTRIAAIPELVVDGVTGRVVPPGRADLLADALEQLARRPQDRTRLGRAGREAVLREFTPATTGPAMADFLAGVHPRTDRPR